LKTALRTLLCTLLVLCGLSFAQNQNPIPVTAPYEDHGSYSVSLVDLSITLNTPFRHKSGLIDFSSHGTAATGVLAPDLYGGTGLLPSHTTTPPVIAGFIGVQVSSIPTSQAYCPGGGSQTWEYSAWVLSETNGDFIPLVPAPGSSSYVDLKSDGVTSCLHNTATFITVDGSNLTVVVSSSPKTAYIYGPDGSYGVANTGSWTPSLVYQMMAHSDRNGNTISLNTSTGVFTDTLGTAALTQTLGNTSDYAWTDANGYSQRTELTTTSLTGATRFSCAQYGNHTDTSSTQYLTGFSYANGTSLGVTYEQTPGLSSRYTTGRVANLTLPTGGSVAFSYGTFNCAYYLPNTIQRTTSDGTWTYAFSKDTGVGNLITTVSVTNPHGDVSTYSSTHTSGTIQVPSVPLLYKTTSPGQTVVYCYNTTSMCNGTYSVTLPVTRVDVYTTLTGMSTSSRVTRTFDTMGNLLTTASYDFSAVNPAFTTTITYGTLSGSSCLAIGNYITNSPCDVVTVDASGNKLNEDRYVYDAKGNELTHYLWVGTLYSTATYNSNGTVNTATDVSGGVTSYTYGACNGGFATQTTVGSLTSHSTWDCNGGMKTSDTDANGAVVTYGYKNSSGTADPLWRLSSVTDPLLNVAYTVYGTNSVEHTVSFGSSLNDIITTTDGYGRSIRTQKKQGSSYNTVSTVYNVTANSKKISIPCLVALGSDCSVGFSTATFDGNDRVLSSVGGGGATNSSTYTQNDVTSVLSPAPTGEYNKSSQIEIDGFGRTMSSCSILTSGGSSCGQVAGGSGVVTTFAYATAVGSSTSTITRGSESKTVVKDALGRVTSTTTPEQGTITYSYDTYSGNCLYQGYSGNAYGHLISKVDAIGNTVCYQYDSLGRLTDSSSNIESTTNPCLRLRYDTVANAINTTPPSGYNAATANIQGRLMQAETDAPCTAQHVVLTDEWFSYNAKGQLTDVWEYTPHSGGYYHTTVTYAANGSVSTFNGLPGYPTMTYGLDADGNVSTAVEGTTTIIAGVLYGPVGPLDIDIGSGTDDDEYQYDVSTGKMTQYQFFVGSANTLGVLNWNINGSLGSLAITDGFNAGGTHTCSFGYDDISRIVSDSCGSTWGQTFSYDQYNNLTKAGSSSWNPGYNTKNQYANIGATYDANGNVIYDSVQHYTWNVYGTMASSSGNPPTCGTNGVCYTYDALGRMVEKSAGSAFSEILYTPLGKTAVMNGLTTVTYSYLPLPGGGTLYSTGVAGANRFYQHKDWLGSARLRSTIPVTGNGTVFYDRAFAPYGEEYANFGSTQPWNFTGDTQEFAMWLSDTPNRELNNGQGRWESPDPSGSGWNLYAYGTDPNRQTDPTGLVPCVWCPGSMFAFVGGMNPSAQQVGATTAYAASSTDSAATMAAMQLAPINMFSLLSNALDAITDILVNAQDMSAGCDATCSANGGILPAGDIIGGGGPFFVSGVALDLGDYFVIKTVVSEDGGLAGAPTRSIPQNPLFETRPGSNGWEPFNPSEQGPIERNMFNRSQGWHSDIKAGGAFSKVDRSTLPLRLSSSYYEGLDGMWRISDHTMMDVGQFMTPEQIAEYGGQRLEDQFGTSYIFQKPITLFIKWENYTK